jgi:hypothetical protein
MERAKTAKGYGPKARIGGSASAQTDQMNTPKSGGKKAVRKKTTSRKPELERPLRKKMGRESKSSSLVCRYCGSEDLAPSFIKRRDADAGNVSVNAMAPPHGRGRQRRGSSSVTARDQRPDSKGLVSLFPPIRMQLKRRLLKVQIPPFSAIESFSVCNSARDHRNPRVRARFRTACGDSQSRIKIECKRDASGSACGGIPVRKPPPEWSKGMPRRKRSEHIRAPQPCARESAFSFASFRISRRTRRRQGCRSRSRDGGAGPGQVAAVFRVQGDNLRLAHNVLHYPS